MFRRYALSENAQTLVDQLKPSYEEVPDGMHLWFFSSDWLKQTRRMQDQGYFVHAPESYDETMKNCRRLFGKQRFTWKTNKHIPAEPSEALLFSGILASYALTPEEFWKLPNEDFHTILGANYFNQRHYKFKKTRKLLENNKELIITHHEDGETRIYETNLSYEKTINPFGNKTSVKPLTEEDTTTHSFSVYAEDYLLVYAIRFAEQTQTSPYANKTYREEQAKKHLVNTYTTINEQELHALQQLQLAEIYTEQPAYLHRPTPPNARREQETLIIRDDNKQELRIHKEHIDFFIQALLTETRTPSDGRNQQDLYRVLQTL
ncbi:MAG: hypothetical protein ACMXYD_04385 [Candidatus Woesearchaeota archaeon]